MSNKQDYSGIKSYKELCHKLYKESGERALERAAWKENIAQTADREKKPSFLATCEKYIKSFQANVDGVCFRLNEIGKINQMLKPQYLSGSSEKLELGGGTPYKVTNEDGGLVIYCATDEGEQWDAMNTARLYVIDKDDNLEIYAGKPSKIDDKHYKAVFENFDSLVSGSNMVSYGKPDKGISDIVMFKLEAV